MRARSQLASLALLASLATVATVTESGAKGCIGDECLPEETSVTTSVGLGPGSYNVTLYRSNGSRVQVSADAPSGSEPAPRYEWKWVPACSVNSLEQADVLCSGVQACPDPGDERSRVLYRLVGTSERPWVHAGTHCLAPDPTFDLAAARAEIERRFYALPLPAAQLGMQPGGRTLVNFPTIFYLQLPNAAERGVSFELSALGRQVHLVAFPAGYVALG